MNKILVAHHDQTEDKAVTQFARQLAGLIGAQAVEADSIDPESVLDQAVAGNFDLVVVPWTGKPRLDRKASRIASHASMSALVVKHAPESLSEMLLCTGGRPIAAPVVKFGAELARAASARVTLLHVTSVVPAMYTGLEAMDESIEDLMSTDTPEAQHLRISAQTLDEFGVNTVVELRHGAVVEEILRSTQLRHYDLIVIGASDSAPPLNRLFFGQVAEKILEHASASVLMVRHQDPDPA